MDADQTDAAVVDAAGLEAGSGDASAPPDAAVSLDATPGVDSGAFNDAGFDAGAVDSGISPPPDAGPPDSGTAPPPPFTTVFSTRPGDNRRDLTIENALIDLIDRAIPGSRIRVALFTFTRASGSSALIRAHDRGVDVRVVLDGNNPSGLFSELPILVAGLGASRVTVCDAPGTACVGSGIMHHKTFLFSELDDGSLNVLVQTSHNVTNSQLSMHNNALIIRGDTALFDAYETNWDDLRADVEIPDYYRIEPGDFATRVYFFPRPSGDTVTSILNNITCDGTSIIRVAMAFFTNPRSAVADRLADRQSEGCDVRVVIGNASIPIGSTILSALTAGGVDVTLFPERSGGWGLHSKYMLIDAPYAGSSAHRRLVFTGSHNWTGAALTINDETMLRIEDDAVFSAFLADWARVRVSASTP